FDFEAPKEPESTEEPLDLDKQLQKLLQGLEFNEEEPESPREETPSVIVPPVVSSPAGRSDPAPDASPAMPQSPASDERADDLVRQAQSSSWQSPARAQGFAASWLDRQADADTSSAASAVESAGG